MACQLARREVVPCNCNGLGRRGQHLDVPPHPARRKLPQRKKSECADGTQPMPCDGAASRHGHQRLSRDCQGNSHASMRCSATAISIPITPKSAIPTIVMSFR